MKTKERKVKEFHLSVSVSKWLKQAEALAIKSLDRQVKDDRFRGAQKLLDNPSEPKLTEYWHDRNIKDALAVARETYKKNLPLPSQGVAAQQFLSECETSLLNRDFKFFEQIARCLRHGASFDSERVRHLDRIHELCKFWDEAKSGGGVPMSVAMRYRRYCNLGFDVGLKNFERFHREVVEYNRQRQSELKYSI